MTVKLKLSVGEEKGVDLILDGPSKAVEELVQRLQSLNGPVSVAGGRSCWTLTREGTTLHVVVDSEKVA